jgi:hypothetical protein
MQLRAYTVAADWPAVARSELSGVTSSATAITTLIPDKFCMVEF